MHHLVKWHRHEKTPSAIMSLIYIFIQDTEYYCSPNCVIAGNCGGHSLRQGELSRIRSQ